MAAVALRRLGMLGPALAVRDALGGVRAALARARAHLACRDVLRRDRRLRLACRDGVWELAWPADRLVVREAMVDNLEMTARALDRHAIPHFVVPIASPNRYRLGVPAAWRAQALEALGGIGDAAAYAYLDDRAVTPRLRRISLAAGLSRRARRRACDRRVWRVYTNHADAAGTIVLGHLYGCEVEFWAEPPCTDDGPQAGRMVAARWNRAAREVSTDTPVTGSITIRDRAYPALQDGATAHVDDVTFPVDVVYTWVDGNDPAWLDRKNAVLRRLDLATSHPDSYDASRYRSRDELKYSLRSVGMFADFVRHVYIVTDEQTPRWLNTDNPRVTVVSHKEIFDQPDQLPTFNSHAIEARLHHIPGLAEHFLYLNDDFFFCRRVVPELFFLSNGMTRFFPSSARVVPDDGSAPARSVDVAAQNSQDLIRRHFGRVTRQKIKHAPYPQRRSVLQEAEETFPDQFARTAANQIRTPADLPVASAFSHYYGYLTGRAAPGDIAAQYIELAAEDLDRRLDRLTRKRNADTLCINDAAFDDTTEVAAREHRLQQFLDTYWPVKSEFEW